MVKASVSVSSLFQDFLSLLFPEECRACGGELAIGEDVICSHCRIKLPYTNFHLMPKDNVLHKVFWGRVPVQLAVSYLMFQEKSRVQRLLHQLKYRGREEVGEVLGRWYGAQLQQQEAFTDVDVVIPVPLYKAKRQQRGYNQVSAFGQEIASALQVSFEEYVLKKSRSSKTQTKKNRQQRWEAMRQLYSVAQKERIVGKHVLLIDDVVTTGATLEACSSALLAAGAKAVSIATIAYTL
ncbi:ComF family protein [Nibribacter ruber]|uniref:ComF family protein n=1 Tax=Nibribacter ruber TaxID=2698458 RepID=A0A6P1P0M6_9BACT|nr:phosphoribosyltransferase family protein [Nibribacter ruber]QHL88145.1 ComF family protein [Nibribacter ruber]